VQILDIYAASEEPIPGVDARRLVQACGKKSVTYASGFEEAAAQAAASAEEGDVILTMGAGNVSQVAPMVLEQLENSKKPARGLK
jgi:UDP-N-acetylmuramate--alanine ligase